MSRTDFEEVLISRDGLTMAEARREKLDARNAILEIIDNDGDYDDVEDFFADEFGLEMDYIEDVLF